MATGRILGHGPITLRGLVSDADHDTSSLQVASGTSTGNGAYPGDPNDSSARSVVCACFAE